MLEFEFAMGDRVRVVRYPVEEPDYVFADGEVNPVGRVGVVCEMPFSDQGAGACYRLEFDPPMNSHTLFYANELTRQID